jgi:AcrR family transcriptional regulator
MKVESATRRQVMEAALQNFAHSGYANTSVQEIVDAARVTKPTLYYYFESKAGLYQALIDRAHDERLRLMQEAAARCDSLPEALIEIFTATFEFAKKHRELMRLAFATAFAAPGEIPREIQTLKKAVRNFEFVEALMKKGLAQGVFDQRFNSKELTMSFYGLLSIYIMGQTINPCQDLDSRAAERLVRLFLEGAAATR